MRNRKKLLLSIIIMLALTLAASAWLVHRSAELRSAKAEAERIAEAELAKKQAEEEAAAKKEAEDVEIASHIYSHRGSAGPYEHSFKAYDDAIAAGSRYIEQDLVISADGVLFVSHDKTAYAMTGNSAAYADMDAEEIDTLRTYEGNKILRLSEVFDRYGRDINYVIELKSSDEATVEAFDRTVREYGLQDLVTVQSFFATVLKSVDAVLPDMTKLLLCDSQDDIDFGLKLPYVDIVSVGIDYGLMTKENCEAAHESGKLFSAWTLDAEESIRRAISMGVDTYFTNDTPLAVSLEREFGLKERQAKNSDTLFFASDYQIRPEWDSPAENLRAILKKLNEEGKSPSNAIYCGDYTNDDRLHDYQLSPDDPIEEIREITLSECAAALGSDMIFVQGNHDKLTDQISESGLHEYDKYLVYVLNTQYDFPWKQGRNSEFRDRVSAASEELGACLRELISKGEKRPVFIAGHVPLHFTARTSSRHDTGDNMYAKYIFDEVNEAAKSLDIVYLFGHNHSKGWDCYMGGSSVFKRPGDTVLIPEAGSNTSFTDDYSEESLNFTYMNAGYVGHYMNCSSAEFADGSSDDYHAADETLTGTICEIKPDELVISRYSAEGIHPLGGKGEADPYKGGIDAGLIGPEHYSRETQSPAHITRRNKAAGG